MQRTSANGPTHLFTHDFATNAAPVPQARDNRGVDWYRWAPDGTDGIGLVDGNPLLLTPGSSARDLGDSFDSVTYAADSLTAYGLRTTLAGSNDRSELVAIDVATGAVSSLATWTYPHPTTFQEAPVREAQFADNGGFERVFVLDDGRVVVWVLGAPAIYTFDPATGTTGTLDRMPLLWAPNGQIRTAIGETGSTTRIAIVGVAGEERGVLAVSGLVSHARWSANSNQIVFTINRGTSGGGVAQDLYAWDLQTGSSAVRLTQDLRSRGGEYRGAMELWKP
jgi:dipeptidyl aminopeptidase/acylaminoacyl peptidase